MAWFGLAKIALQAGSKLYANRNNKALPKNSDKKDTNPVSGTRAARPQKPVTWY